MPRIRTVKPEYPKNRKVRRIGRDERLLNIHLWNLADDEGRLQELIAWIIGEVFPTDDDVTPQVLRRWLERLEKAGLIIRYEVAGERYIQCHDWSEHQKINHPSKSLIPPPEADSACLPEDSGNPPVTLPEDSGGEQGTGNREQGKENNKASNVDLIWDHYVKVMGKRGRGKELREDERKIIRDALRAADVEEIKTAISTCQASDYHMKRGRYSKRTGSKYNALGKILKPRPTKGETQRSRIEWWLERENEPNADDEMSAFLGSAA